MACIDIFQPGRLLTVDFLAEQIWLRAKGKRLLATEVYDFLLHVDDNQPLNSFLIGSPHFCRRRTRNNAWKDSVYMLPFGDGNRTNWGWFYYGDQIRDNDQLEVRIPNCAERGGQDTLPLKGIDLFASTIQWDDRLADDNSVELMHQIKKSLYRVTFDKPLLPYGENRMWFRLLVEPSELDIFAPIRGVGQSFVDALCPIWKLANAVTCPWNVRRAVIERLDAFRRQNPHKGPQVDLLKQRIVAEGFEKPGTSTRIVEHRIMLSGEGVDIDIQGSPPALTYLGAQPVKSSLPSFGHDYALDATPSGKEIVTVVHYAAGGSTRNGENDVLAVASQIIDEARVSPKTKMQLAQAIAPSAFRQACFLIDMMVELGLLTKDANDVCRATNFSQEIVLERLAELRRRYMVSEYFGDFPEAQEAFADLHPFRFDFTCTWSTYLWTRMVALNAIAFCAVAGFIVGLTSLLMHLLR